MTITLRFTPSLFVAGLAYMPGIAFGIHIPLFALVIDFTDDDDDDGGELRPIEDPA